MQKANCSGANPNWFFELYEEDPEIKFKVDQLCDGCKVYKECYSYALETESEGGQFGRVFIPLKDKNKKRKKKND